jgi:hypothetical protein
VHLDQSSNSGVHAKPKQYSVQLSTRNIVIEGFENLNILTHLDVAHLQSDSFLQTEWTIPCKCVDVKNKWTRKTGFQRLSHFKTLRGMILVQQKGERGQNTCRNFDILSARLPSKNILRSSSPYYINASQIVFAFTTTTSLFQEFLL